MNSTLALSIFLFLINNAAAGSFNLYQSMDSTVSASTIILYHPAKSFGSDFYYYVYLNDSIVYATEWGTADTVYVQASNEYIIRAKTGKKETFPIQIEKGKTYYIRCGTKRHFLISRPTFELVEKDIAEKELIKIKNNKD
jgi:hypothetical protein